jgi:CheY-like chemotaxis protein
MGASSHACGALACRVHCVDSVMATAVPNANAIPRGRLLIVDDDDVVRVTTQAVLNGRGFDTVAVSSGAEALAYLARDTPALMLLDLNMDDMSGWEVMSEVQRNPRLRDMKIVVVSGEQSPKIPRRFHYMKKPFKLEQLFALLAA